MGAREGMGTGLLGFVVLVGFRLGFGVKEMGLLGIGCRFDSVLWTMSIKLLTFKPRNRYEYTWAGFPISPTFLFSMDELS